MLSSPLRCRQQLDDRVSARLRDPGRGGPAEHSGGDIASCAGSSTTASRSTIFYAEHAVRVTDVPERVVRRVDEPGTSRPGRHALSIGVDVSSRISILYAPPAAWSHATCGVPTSSRSRGRGVLPADEPRDHAGSSPGRGRAGTADRYALKIDSPTAVRDPERARRRGTPAQLAIASFTTLTARRCRPEARSSRETRRRRSCSPRRAGLGSAVQAGQSVRCSRRSTPSIGVPQDRRAHRAAQPGRLTLRNLGFVANPVSTVDSEHRA